MSAVFPASRFAQILVTLIVAVVSLSAPTGCRIFQKKSPATAVPPPIAAPAAANRISAPPPQVPAALPAASPSAPATPDIYAAFRPIMPDEFPNAAVRNRAVLPPIPFAPAPDRNRPPNSPPPETFRSEADRQKIEELSRTIQHLEHQLAESKRNEEQLKAAAVITASSPPPSGDAVPAAAEPGPKLPVINKPGITVHADAQRQIHIEVMDKVLFMPNTWQLTSEGEEVLRSVGAEIKAFAPNSIIAVEGHTDSLAGDPANRIQKHDVSSIKAMAVMEFFINTLRWNAAAVETRSCGLSRPVADNATPEGRARNNRIELVIRNVL